MWRVITGRHESVELAFMLVGHTKFSPDRFFGLFKKAFRRATVCTICIARSFKIYNQWTACTPAYRDMCGDVQVRFQWSAHLGQFFRSIPNSIFLHKSLPDHVCLHKYSGSQQTRVQDNYESKITIRFHCFLLLRKSTGSYMHSRCE